MKFRPTELNEVSTACATDVKPWVSGVAVAEMVPALFSDTRVLERSSIPIACSCVTALLVGSVVVAAARTRAPVSIVMLGTLVTGVVPETGCPAIRIGGGGPPSGPLIEAEITPFELVPATALCPETRSEERRVGKE